VLRLQYLGQREAQRFDEQLMSAKHGFSIDQLMELAGLSVAAAVGKQFPIAEKDEGGSTSAGFKRVLVVAGPGNNGWGSGL
jgi:NAD(P)H-hydrate repair Nnr-like enzyme with NAD(P)H-hydrate epimerase domain